MLRFLKYLLVILFFGALALFGYSFLLEPQMAPPGTTIEIDAG